MQSTKTIYMAPKTNRWHFWVGFIWRLVFSTLCLIWHFAWEEFA